MWEFAFMDIKLAFSFVGSKSKHPNMIFLICIENSGKSFNLTKSLLSLIELFRLCIAF